MPDDDAPRQLAAIALVTDELDRILDRLFASAAELRAILASAAQNDDPDKEMP